MRLELWQDGRRGVEPLQLELRELGIDVRRREGTHEPDGIGRGIGQLEQAVAPHPGVDLQVQRHVRGEGRLGDGQLEIGRADSVEVVAEARAHDEDASVRDDGARSATPSPAVTTHSVLAPSSRATRATSAAPWP